MLNSYSSKHKGHFSADTNNNVWYFLHVFQQSVLNTHHHKILTTLLQGRSLDPILQMKAEDKRGRLVPCQYAAEM